MYTPGALCHCTAAQAQNYSKKWNGALNSLPSEAADCRTQLLAPRMACQRHPSLSARNMSLVLQVEAIIFPVSSLFPSHKMHLCLLQSRAHPLGPRSSHCLKHPVAFTFSGVRQGPEVPSKHQWGKPPLMHPSGHCQSPWPGPEPTLKQAFPWDPVKPCHLVYGD